MPGAMLVQSIQVRAAARDAERARALLAIYVCTLHVHTAQSLRAIPTIAGRAWRLKLLLSSYPEVPSAGGPLVAPPSFGVTDIAIARSCSPRGGERSDGGRRETGVCPVMAGGRP